MIKRIRYRDTPRCCQGFLARPSDRDPARGLHQGQQSNVLRSKAGQMTAIRNDLNQSKITLAKQEPSTNDTTLRGSVVRRGAAFALRTFV